MRIWSAVLVLFAAVQSQPTEPKRVPADSIEITAVGCLKGRVFTATARGPRDGEIDVKRGPDVAGHSFRLNGPRDLMKDVKKHDGHLVEVVGLVRRSALADTTPGMKVGNTRIVIGASPRSNDPAASHAPVAAVAVMDATSVRFLSESCPIRRE